MLPRKFPLQVLGGGSNLLVREEGVSGAVVRLSEPAFSELKIEGTVAKAQAGCQLSHVVTETVRVGLAGFETLSGIPGTIGGAIRGNAGGRQGEIGPLVKSISFLSMTGERKVLSGEELTFEYRRCLIEQGIILSAEFQLTPENPDQLAQRLRQIWITKRTAQPMGSQSAGCIFKNPQGTRAGVLIDQAGLKGTRVGGAEVSDRHANFIVTHEGATSQDVLRLIDLVRSKVAEQFGVQLELEIQVW